VPVQPGAPLLSQTARMAAAAPAPAKIHHPSPAPKQSPLLATMRGEALCHELLLRAEANPQRRTLAQSLSAAAERIVEIVVALVALTLTAPIMLVLIILVRRDTPGPAIFRQKRVGLNGRLFTFYKFRTLYVDARQRFPELYSYSYSREEIQQLAFKREQDPRVTPMGRWLRKSTMDEFPNFWNLLKGDLALVGPRPEIPEMVPHYRPEQLAKFSVKPGITGLAQTNGRGKLSFQDTIAWDLEYVKRRSLWLDVKAVLKTIQLVLRLDGAF